MDTRDIKNFLNHILSLDRSTVSALLQNRMKASEPLMESEMVIVGEDGQVGLMGILNGLLSYYAEHKITMVVDPTNGEIRSFV